MFTLYSRLLLSAIYCTLFQHGDVSWMLFSSDIIVMGLHQIVNMLMSYLIGFVWTCFIKYVALNKCVCMTFCLCYQPVQRYASFGSFICTTPM